MKINEIISETTSGGIAVVAQPIGKMVKRADASIYKKKKIKKTAVDEEKS